MDAAGRKVMLFANQSLYEHSVPHQRQPGSRHGIVTFHASYEVATNYSVFVIAHRSSQLLQRHVFMIMVILRSGRRLRAETPEDAGPAPQDAPVVEKIPTAEDVPAAVWHPVWVMILRGGGFFKHWSLFVENEQDPSNGFVMHVVGSSGQFRYEQRTENTHLSESLLESIQVGHVYQRHLQRLKRSVKDVEVRNIDPTWNCQDFVWRAIGEIAAEGLIDAEDELYTTGRETVWSRMEGFA